MGESVNFGAMLVNLAGGLALFLYGMHKMTEALKVLAGERVKDLLSTLTRNRFGAALAGAAVTAVIQSSSITTVLVVGFITAGVMSFPQSIGVILGANVGTTVTAQIIAFKITRAALFLIAIGFFSEVLARAPRLRHFGSMLMGLGLLFFGMELMSQATAPLRDYEPFMTIVRELRNPVAGVLIGALFTAVVQSSSATTAIVIVMASQSLISLEAGIALIFGSNIGTCVTAWLSSLGKPREAVQAVVAHVLFNVGGVLLFVGFIPAFADLVRAISPAAVELTGAARLAADTPRQLANAHTLFNVFNLLLFLGFTQTLARVVLRIVPPRAKVARAETQPIYLDAMYLDTPAMAFDRVRLELDRVSQKALGMLAESFPCLLVGTRERIASLGRRADEINALTDAIVLYLRRLSTTDLVEPQPTYLEQYLGIASALAQIGDIISRGIAVDSLKRLDHGVVITGDNEALLRDIYKTVYASAQMTRDAIAGQDTPARAATVLASKEQLQGLIERGRSRQYMQLKGQHPNPLQEYKVESNTLENYRRIHMLLRSICKLLLSRAGAGPVDAPATEVQPRDEAA